MRTSYPPGCRPNKMLSTSFVTPKARSNPENNVGLITLANDCEMLTTLTPDTGHTLSKLHTVQPKGKITFCTGIPGKNHKMRIIALVGSPVEDNEKDLVKLAKRFKKEKVNVDIISLGKEEVNTEKLTAFVNTLKGKDGTGSHLVAVSPVLGWQGGATLGLGASGFEFGVDPSADPKQRQRQRQAEEARGAAAGPAAEAGMATAGMTFSPQELGRSGPPDLRSTTEEEQIASGVDASSATDTSEPFLQSVLENLPGVDLKLFEMPWALWPHRPTRVTRRTKRRIRNETGAKGG
ncbi:unnamed protein product [Nyctereutes procyonoides]|uniref:(raccoon dog) hypothetical protein n=1 Tax=Nyctereutes procyonoides TaxID=34880 RepID=A0A811ZP05_NYCPR|nr:unnamed protein product [Nyctereutes procyonoides]